MRVCRGADCEEDDEEEGLEVEEGRLMVHVLVWGEEVAEKDARDGTMIVALRRFCAIYVW